MKTKTNKLETIILHMECDCGGEYVSDSECSIIEILFNAASNKKIRHKCTKCGKIEYLDMMYPKETKVEVPYNYDSSNNKSNDVNEHKKKLTADKVFGYITCPICNTAKFLTVNNSEGSSIGDAWKFDISCTCTQCNGTVISDILFKQKSTNKPDMITINYQSNN